MSFTANIDDVVAANRNGLLAAHPSWQRTRLKEVATILNGYPFESARFTKEKGMSLIRIRDILPGQTETFYNGDFDPTFLVQPGELVVGMDGDFHCAAWSGGPSLLNQRVCKITPDETRYSKKFLRYVLPGYLSAINAETPSVTVKHLSSRTVSDIPLPLPPLKEQRRIVAEIEKQFTRLEAGVAALRRVQANLKRYRAAVLKAACEGRLTEELENASLPDALLKLAESDDAIAGSGELLPTLPKSWRWVLAGNVLQTRQGVQIPKSEQRESACPGFKRYLYISDFKHSESLKFVEDKYPDQEVTERDVIMANTGSPGEVFRGTDGILSNNLFRISFNPEHFHHRFVYYYFKSPLFLARIKLKGGAQQHLGHRTIAAHRMTLPPLVEHTRIVAEVERRLSVVEELESVVSANLQRATRLRQSILQRAFTGELV